MRFGEHSMSVYLDRLGRQIDLPQANALIDQKLDVRRLFGAMDGPAKIMVLERHPNLLDEPYLEDRPALRAMLATHLTPPIIARWRSDLSPTLRWLSWVFDRS